MAPRARRVYGVNFTGTATHTATSEVHQASMWVDDCGGEGGVGGSHCGHAGGKDAEGRWAHFGGSARREQRPCAVAGKEARFAGA